jgi:hypothetical protein
VCGVVGVTEGPADAAAGGDLVAVCCCPLADLAEFLGVSPLRRTTGGAPAAAAARLPGCGDVVGDRFAELFRVVVGEVDFVVGAVDRQNESCSANFI